MRIIGHASPKRLASAPFPHTDTQRGVGGGSSEGIRFASLFAKRMTERINGRRSRPTSVPLPLCALFFLLFSRMILRVNRFELGDRDPCVDLRGLNGRVAQELLKMSDRRTILQHVRGRRVP